MDKDYINIMNSLTKFHALFSEFWSVGYITETHRIPTAAVTFDEVGQSLEFLINPEFWKDLSFTDKQFVICHECLHLYLDHGPRIRFLKDKNIANIAADLVVNHYLIDKFNFDRDQLSFIPIGGVENLIWLDSPSLREFKLPPSKSMENYYNLLIANIPECDLSTLDSHEFSEDNSEGSKSGLEDFVNRITENTSIEEVEDFMSKINSNSDESSEVNSSMAAGNIPGSLTKKIVLSKVVKKKTWERLFKENLCKSKGPEITVPKEQWSRENRRFTCLDKNLMIPSEVDTEVIEKSRINVWLFQDTSGSCAHYAERFFKAARSIPEDKFNVRGFCFDTQVYEVDYKKGELRGFGGTYFHIIEQYIQNLINKEECDYPEYVFIVTDGYGDYVYPKYPERWHWLLTEYNCHDYIPQSSKKLLLSNFE